MSLPALFLDRDGVINIDKAYVHKPEDCEFVEGIFSLVSRANNLGYKVIIVTNQAGIARGYYSEEQFLEFSAWMRQQFETKNARIDMIYFCPHHPVHGKGEYLTKCDCRKPEPGMFLRAKNDLDIDMSNSLMVGDNYSDLEAAKQAGIKKLFLLSHISSTPRESTASANLHASVVHSLEKIVLHSF